MLILRAGKAERERVNSLTSETHLLITSRKGQLVGQEVFRYITLHAYVHAGLSPEIYSRGVWAESKALNRCMRCGALDCLPSLAAGHLDRLACHGDH